jgi:hypothetical protein
MRTVECRTQDEEVPKRRYEITVRVGADDWDSAMMLLRDFCEHIPEHGEKCSLVSGGPTAGGSVMIEHRPEVTHDRYFAQVEEWKKKGDKQLAQR